MAKVEKLESAIKTVLHIGHAGWKSHEWIAAQLQPLKILELGDAVGQEGYTVAAQVELAQVGHGEHLTRNGLQPLVVQLEYVNIGRVFDIFERLIHLVGLSEEGAAQEKHKCEQEIAFHIVWFVIGWNTG